MGWEYSPDGGRRVRKTVGKIINNVERVNICIYSSGGYVGFCCSNITLCVGGTVLTRDINEILNWGGGGSYL